VAFKQSLVFGNSAVRSTHWSI